MDLIQSYAGLETSSFERLGSTFPPSSPKVVDVHHGPGDDDCVTVHAFLFLDQVQELLDNLSICGDLNNLCANELETYQFGVAVSQRNATGTERLWLVSGP
jgi:hypothetical protein